MRSLIALLLLRANDDVTQDQIAIALGGEDAAADAGKRVQMQIHRLHRVRRTLGDPNVLVTTPTG